MSRKPRRKRIKVPKLFVDCASCGEEFVEIGEILRLDGGHIDVCAARPVLLRVDSDAEGNWVPIIQTQGELAGPDKIRIRAQVAKMIEAHERRD